jgi:rod shape-determining protein MreC
VALSRRPGRSRFTLLLLILTSVTALTLDFRGSGLIDGARSVALTVFGPVKSAASSAFTPVTNTWHGVADYSDVKHENDRLRRRIAELEGEAARKDDAAQQFKELLKERDIPYVGDLPRATARVVSGPASNFAYTLEIDKGTAKGVKKDMPVINGAGLVGRVVAVSAHRSTVQLISDPAFAFGVRLVDSQDVGIARGRGQGRPVVADGIDPATQVKKGTVVTTSGLDRSLFPGSIPVGKVVSARPSSDDLQQEVTLRPLADLAQLSFVDVLLWEPTS